MIASIGMNDLCRYEFGESFTTLAVKGFPFRSPAINGNKKSPAPISRSQGSFVLRWPVELFSLD